MAKVTINGYEVELSIAELQQLVGAPAPNANADKGIAPPRRKARGIRSGSVEELILFTFRELSGGELDITNGEFSTTFLSDYLKEYCRTEQVVNGCSRLWRKNRLRKTKRGHYRLPEKKGTKE